MENVLTIWSQYKQSNDYITIQIPKNKIYTLLALAIKVIHSFPYFLCVTKNKSTFPYTNTDLLNAPLSGTSQRYMQFFSKFQNLIRATWKLGNVHLFREILSFAKTHCPISKEESILETTRSLTRGIFYLGHRILQIDVLYIPISHCDLVYLAFFGLFYSYICFL